MKVVLTFLMLTIIGNFSFSQTCNLFFSEYLEGSSNNKALEIYNPLNVSVNLIDYKVFRYNNGSPTPTDSLQLVGTLAPGAVYVMGNPSAIASILLVSDTLHTITFFNGDDALELRYMPTNTTLDVFGIIGNDPGTNWAVGSGATSEFTLVRMSNVTHGELTWTNSIPQWNVYPQNTESFIGSHSGTPCCTPNSSSQSATNCGSFVWSQTGLTYSTSGQYSDTLTNVAGCDSIIYLNLTINPIPTGTDVQTACVSYTWIDGNTYTTSNNTATFTIAGGAANGCDSIVTLDLTINQPTTGTDVQTACGTYTWIDGITYTSSNNNATFTIVGGASNGCDSVVTLDLTINQPATGTDVQTACGTFTWIDGITYTSSNNTATFTFVAGAANGCDSVVTLDLTIVQPATGTDVQSACDTYTWIDGNTYTSSNNTATFTIAGGAANGCDSVVTLNLTITTTPTATATDNGDATITASAGATYQWIDCGTGSAIAGETGQTLTVAANGSYAVVVSNGSCADTSACVLIDYIGIKELVETAVQLMPNPTRDNVTITMSVASATLEVRDAQGKLMVAKAITSGEQVDLSQAEVGVYFFTIKTANGSVVKRVVKN